jgi:hypothetical protein
MRPRKDADKLGELSNAVEFIAAFTQAMDCDVAASALMIVLARVINTMPDFQWEAFDFHLRILVMKGKSNE